MPSHVALHGSSSSDAAAAAALGPSGAGHGAGLAPDPGAVAGDEKFLREDATWANPPSGPAIFVASGGSHATGIVPDPGAVAGTDKFLREDATWATPAGGSADVFGAAGPDHSTGIVPDPGPGGGDVKFLCEDASWAIPPGDSDALLNDNNLSDVSDAATSRTNLGLAAVAASGSASDLGTGTLPIARVASAAVTLAKLADLAQATVIGRASGAGTGVPTALTASDLSTILGTLATTKAYVDALSQGLQWKASVRAASGSALTFSSNFANGSVVDGVTLVTGDRILIKHQSTGSQNGIYTVNASGSPTRATDADTSAELLAAAVFVQEGDTQADRAFVCTTDAPITVGTTALTFVGFASALGALVASNNLSDLASAAAARSNLGLAAVAASGAMSDLTGVTLATTTLSGTGTLAFTGLAGNSARKLRISFTAKCSNGSKYEMHINSDTGSYPMQFISGTYSTPGTIVGADPSPTGLAFHPQTSNAGFVHGFIEFGNPAAGDTFRGFVGESFGYDQGTGNHLACAFGGSWLDTTNEITSITFAFTGTLTNFRATLETVL